MSAGGERPVLRPDGPHSPEYTLEVAVVFSDSVRVLNHATLPANRWPGLEAPQDVYDLVGCLELGADRLTQTVNQLAYWLQRNLEAGRFAETPGGPWGGASGVVQSAAGSLVEAQVHAHDLGRALARAHTALSGLTAADDGPGGAS